MLAPVRGSVRWTGSIVVLALGLGGCAGAKDALPRKEITGTVTLDSAPLPHGMIQFLPAASRAAPASGPGGSPAAVEGETAVSVPITDGKFAIERAQGLVPGSYKVQVYGANLTSAAADVMPGLEPPPPKETIPARYNTKSQLTAEVKEEGPNTFEFQLKK